MKVDYIVGVVSESCINRGWNIRASECCYPFSRESSRCRTIRTCSVSTGETVEIPIVVCTRHEGSPLAPTTTPTSISCRQKSRVQVSERDDILCSSSRIRTTDDSTDGEGFCRIWTICSYSYLASGEYYTRSIRTILPESCRSTCHGTTESLSIIGSWSGIESLNYLSYRT